MNCLSGAITSRQICSLLYFLKESKITKEEELVTYQELLSFIILLKDVGPYEIITTKQEAKDFYFICLAFVERLIKFNGVTDLEYMLEPLRKMWSSGTEVISLVYLFNNNESARIFFIARMEEITEDILAQKYSSTIL